MNPLPPPKMNSSLLEGSMNSKLLKNMTLEVVPSPVLSNANTVKDPYTESTDVKQEWQILRVIGKGGSSTVFKAIVVDTMKPESTTTNVSTNESTTTTEESVRGTTGVNVLAHSMDEVLGSPYNRFPSSSLQIVTADDDGIQDDPLDPQVVNSPPAPISSTDTSPVDDKTPHKLVAGQLLAVKQIDILSLTRTQREAILAEIQMMRSLSHPNIVRFLGSQRTPNRFLIAMEFANLGSLRHLYHRVGPLMETETLYALRQILNGLAHLHHLGFAHRDVKCANCLLFSGGRVKLADFGASKRLETESIVSGLKGTPHWMAPEVIRGETLTSGWLLADIWSLGCTVVEMMTGRVPYAEYTNAMTAMYRIAGGEVPRMKIYQSQSGPEHATPSSASVIAGSEESLTGRFIEAPQFAQDFVALCCRVQADQRPSMEELMTSEWLELCPAEDDVPPRMTFIPDLDADDDVSTTTTPAQRSTGKPSPSSVAPGLTGCKSSDILTCPRGHYPADFGILNENHEEENSEDATTPAIHNRKRTFSYNPPAPRSNSGNRLGVNTALPLSELTNLPTCEFPYLGDDITAVDEPASPHHFLSPLHTGRSLNNSDNENGGLQGEPAFDFASPAGRTNHEDKSQTPVLILPSESGALQVTDSPVGTPRSTLLGSLSSPLFGRAGDAAVVINPAESLLHGGDDSDGGYSSEEFCEADDDVLDETTSALPMADIRSTAAEESLDSVVSALTTVSLATVAQQQQQLQQQSTVSRELAPVISVKGKKPLQVPSRVSAIDSTTEEALDTFDSRVQRRNAALMATSNRLISNGSTIGGIRSFSAGAGSVANQSALLNIANRSLRPSVVPVREHIEVSQAAIVKEDKSLLKPLKKQANRATRVTSVRLPPVNHPASRDGDPIVTTAGSRVGPRSIQSAPAVSRSLNLPPLTGKQRVVKAAISTTSSATFTSLTPDPRRQSNGNHLARSRAHLGSSATRTGSSLLKPEGRSLAVGDLLSQ